MADVALPRLMLVADRRGVPDRPLEDVVHAAAVGADGRILVQIRERDLNDDDLAALCERVMARLDPSVRVAVNDRPAVARRLGIGLHLPAASAAPERRPGLMGRSVHDEAEAAAAIADGADYAVVGTIYRTASHPGFEGGGLERVRMLSERLDPIPAYAIGGISAANAALAVAAGAHGAAVRSAVLAADNPAGAARTIVAAVDAMAAASRPARR